MPETLLDELGYITDPRRRLIQLQRQLWRDLRAILDVEIQTKKIDLHQVCSTDPAHRILSGHCSAPGTALCSNPWLPVLLTFSGCTKSCASRISSCPNWAQILPLRAPGIRTDPFSPRGKTPGTPGTYHLTFADGRTSSRFMQPGS